MSFSVTPTNLVSITEKKINGTFHPFRNNRLEKSRKNGKKQKISVLIEFHPSLNKNVLFNFIIPLPIFFEYLELNLSCLA